MEHVVLQGACPCLPQPQFLDMSGPETNASATIFEKCGGKLAWEGRDTTPWDPYRKSLPLSRGSIYSIQYLQYLSRGSIYSSNYI